MSLLLRPQAFTEAEKILNLGSDRWSFRPEIGVSFPSAQQRWVLDGYANCYFYTDNTSYRGTEVLKQGPLPGFEGHLSYTFNPRSCGLAGYALLVPRRNERWNNLGQDDSQRNFVFGSGERSSR